jgi:hypothetical protein
MCHPACHVERRADYHGERYAAHYTNYRPDRRTPNHAGHYTDRQTARHTECQDKPSPGPIKRFPICCGDIGGDKSSDYCQDNYPGEHFQQDANALAE